MSTKVKLNEATEKYFQFTILNYNNTMARTLNLTGFSLLIQNVLLRH